MYALACLLQATDAATGLLYLHMRDILHRDGAGLLLLPCSWLHAVDAAAVVALLLSCCCCALLGTPHYPVAATLLRLVQHPAARACSHPAEAVRIVEGQAQTCDAAQKPSSCAFCWSCTSRSQVAQLSGGGPLGCKSQRLQLVAPARQRAELVKRRPTQPCVAGACEWLELSLVTGVCMPRNCRGRVVCQCAVHGYAAVNMIHAGAGAVEGRPCHHRQRCVSGVAELHACCC